MILPAGGGWRGAASTLPRGHHDGRGAPDEDAAEARRVAFMMAAIVAYKRDKQRAAAASTATGGAGADPWKSFGRRNQMRGGLR